MQWIVILGLKLYILNDKALIKPFSLHFRSSDYGETYQKLNDKIGAKTILSYLYVSPNNKRKVGVSFCSLGDICGKWVSLCGCHCTIFAHDLLPDIHVEVVLISSKMIILIKGISVSMLFKWLLWHFKWSVNALGRRCAFWLHNMQPNFICEVPENLQKVPANHKMLWFLNQARANKGTSQDEAPDMSFFQCSPCVSIIKCWISEMMLVTQQYGQLTPCVRWDF